MVISIRNTDCVRCREVVRFLEGPLTESRLYYRTHVDPSSEETQLRQNYDLRNKLDVLITWGTGPCYLKISHSCNDVQHVEHLWVEI